MVADLHHFDEEQDLDPVVRRGESSDPDPHRNVKRDPHPHRTILSLYVNPVSNLFLHSGFRRGGTSDAQGWIRFHALQGGEVSSAGLQVRERIISKVPFS